MLCDYEGRCIATEMNLNQKKILVIGMYTPNGPKANYFKDIKNKEYLIYDQMIILGDFDGIIDPRLDRWRGNWKGAVGRLPKSWLEILEQENPEDVWRNWNE